MKKFTFLLVIMLIFSIFKTNAKIWSVSKDAAQNADFSKIQDAVDAASPGDYIYVYPSVYDDGFTLGMPLVIVGPGYFLGDNPDTQENKSPAVIKGEVIVGTNTSGTFLAGLNIQNKLTIQSTSNIMVKRNRLYTVEVNNSSSITIKQNFIQGGEIETEHKISLRYVKTTVVVGDNTSGIQIKNNFIGNANLDWDWVSKGCHAIITSNVLSSLYIKNNVLSGNLYLNNSTLENNILINGAIQLSDNSSYSYNVAHNSAFGNNNNNQENVSITTVFISSESTDGQYQLKNGSPAKGAGLDDVDCGMFGGPDPYVLSGIP